MSKYFGDFPVNGIVEIFFNTSGADGASITRATDGTLKIYKDGSVTERSSLNGVIQNEDFDGATGVHRVEIDLSDDTDAGFYAAGSTYAVVMTGMVIDGKTVNHCVGQFSIEQAGGALALLKSSSGLSQIKADTTAILLDTGTDGVVLPQAEADKVWSSASRTLTSFGSLVSDIASAVWSAGARTLTNFGTLVSDIWGAVTRSLTDKAGFSISGTKQTLDALNDLSQAQAQTASADALSAYDPPTKVELDSAVNPLALEATLTAIAGAVALEANIQTHAVAALTAYDPPTKAELDEGLGALNDIIVAEILAGVVEGTLTLQQVLRLLLAALAGKATGGGTGTVTFRDQADSKNRITATVDEDGNRTAVTVDGA